MDTPILLLEQYLQYLEIKNGRPRSQGHIRVVRQRVARMLEGIQRLEQLTPEGIEAKLYELRGELVTKPGSEARPRSNQTLDCYRRELGTFCRWLMVKRRLLTWNPVDSVDRFEAGDLCDPSRPFSPKEFAAFFESCPLERLAIYLFWATTGLRPGETRRLLWGQLILAPADGSVPYVDVRRSTSKNRKDARQPLHPDVVALLSPMKKHSTDPAFSTIPTPNTFLGDLRRAGLEPVRVTPEGRLSRTSLRKLFVTALDRAGATEGLVQKLARHSSPVLTRERYTHHELGEKARAVSLLSFLPTWRKPVA